VGVGAAGQLDYVDYLTFTDKLGILTANATTPYYGGSAIHPQRPQAHHFRSLQILIQDRAGNRYP
jgi:hypothetical protein